MNQVLATVLSNTEVMPDAYVMWLDCPEISQEARPGQFVMVWCGEETVLRRPLSIHQIEGDRLALLYNVIGKGTQWLAECQSGDKVDIFGPMGNGFTVHRDSHNLLLVAGGMGIAPLYYLASSASKKGYSVTIILGARTAIDLYLREYQDKPIKATFALVTEDGTAGEKGIATESVRLHLEGTDQVFACGPLPMYQAMVQIPELKDRPVQVSLEIMMGCGMGVCYGCTIKTKKGLRQVCKDGPVFEMGDMELPNPALLSG